MDTATADLVCTGGKEEYEILRNPVAACDNNN